MRAAFLVLFVLGCGARSGLIDPREREADGRDAGPLPRDAGPFVRDAGPPDGDARVIGPIDAGGVLDCTSGDRFDVIRGGMLVPTTSLDLARGERGFALFLQAQEVSRQSMVAMLDQDGQWTGSSTALDGNGRGSIVHGRLDRAPGFTVAFGADGELVGATLDEDGRVVSRASPTGVAIEARPALAVSDEVMLVAWSTRDRGTRAIVTRLEAGASTSFSVPGVLPAAAIHRGSRIDLAVSLGDAVYFRQLDGFGMTLMEGRSDWTFMHEVIGLDLASTSDGTASIAWARGGGAPVGTAGSFQYTSGGIGHTERYEGMRPIDAAIAHDQLTNLSLAVVSLTGRGVVGYVDRGGTAPMTFELEISGPVTASVGDAPSVSVAATASSGSFLVVWDDVIGGVHGVSARLVTCQS